MNLEEYFKRIEYHGPSEKPDLATLASIHKQHVMTVPFENLSIHCGEQMTMDLETIFNKVVRRGRGGWCCENNSLFGWVLRELGYDCTMLAARVFNSGIGQFNLIESHLIHKVVIDGKAYIADVSFGVSCQIREPLELVSGRDNHQAAGAFRLIDRGEFWVLEKTGRRQEVPNPDFADSSLVEKKQTRQIYCFTLVPRGVEHFLNTSHFLQTDPSSLFTNKSICSLQTAAGYRALVGWTYSEVTFKPEAGLDVLEMMDIPVEDVENVLWQKFNLKTVNRVVPKNNKMRYTL